MNTAVASNISLLRPDQVKEMGDERNVMEQKLRSPHLQEDRGAVADQLRRLNHQLETQAPKQFNADEIDNAIRREAELRAEWSQGMLSQEEMRACPAGAAGKHLNWERKNKTKIMEWKNIQYRLNAGNDDEDSANIERFRPTKNTMNMDGSIVQTKQYYMPPSDAKLGVTFNAEQLALLKEFSPDLAEKIGLMSNEQRGDVKQILAGQKVDGRKNLTEEQIATRSANLAKAREVRKQKAA